MEKESNYLSSLLLFIGALFSSCFYFAVFYLYPSAAWVFLLLTVLFALLGAVKILNAASSHFPYVLNRMVCWLHSLTFEAFSLAAIFAMRPFGLFGWGKGKCGPDNGRPILLIHGYLQNATNWTYLKRTLCQSGLGPIYALSLSHPFRSIRDYAELVSQKALKIAEETGRNDLTLIGHSMGGLVSAWYADQVGEPGKVTDVITIGSPMGGTKWANIAIGPNGREMECGSDFVQELEKCLQNEKIRFYHIASSADQIVIPYFSALTGHHLEREYVVDDLGHMSLLFSSRVAKKIEEWLTAAT